MVEISPMRLIRMR
jgi:hypothetical protein